jgi:hypothetical protein
MTGGENQSFAAVSQSQRDCGLQPKVGAQRLPWVTDYQNINRKAVVANVAQDGQREMAATALRLGIVLRKIAQGSACRATLGFGPESRWDSPLNSPESFLAKPSPAH